MDENDKMFGRALRAKPAVWRRADARRARWYWVVRIKRPLPKGKELGQLTDAVSTRVAAAYLGFYRRDETGRFSEGELRANIAPIEIRRVDSHRFMVAIEFPVPPFAVGDDSQVLTWTALRALDEEFEIEDLQGLPRSHWFQLDD